MHVVLNQLIIVVVKTSIFTSFADDDDIKQLVLCIHYDGRETSDLPEVKRGVLIIRCNRQNKMCGLACSSG